jgi:hypothetical protein
VSVPASAEPVRSDRPAIPSDEVQVAARMALESRIGRSVTDAEWQAMRSKLTEFVTILQGWDSRRRRVGVGNVEALCQREP